MKSVRIALIMVTLGWILWPPAVSLAGKADVVGVKASAGRDGTWSFSVTVRHDDEGWDHYADRWEVLGMDGKVLGTRVLLHPHVGEQPFTRRLDGIRIPEGAQGVLIRAHDSVHGFGGQVMEVELTGDRP